MSWSFIFIKKSQMDFLVLQLLFVDLHRAPRERARENQSIRGRKNESCCWLFFWVRLKINLAMWCFGEKHYFLVWYSIPFDTKTVKVWSRDGDQLICGSFPWESFESDCRLKLLKGQNSPSIKTYQHAAQFKILSLQQHFKILIYSPPQTPN